MSFDSIDPVEFNFVSTKIREFFKKQGLIEVSTQHRLSILAACEDPTTVATFDYCGQVWPLPQTGQMQLEHEILKNPNVPGYFCCTTSYRQELNPVVGRHNLIFPMFEFEFAGDMDILMQFEKALLMHFGYKGPFPEGDYEDICKKYGVSELTHEHERLLCEEYGPVFFLKNFPERTSPFFNMARANGTAKKIDVIIDGMETIGSAERSCDVAEMQELFYSISDGQYAKMLFAKFGKERVEAELTSFLQSKFVRRVGAGIGVTRLISGLRRAGLIHY